jgi:hypothetical protein
MSRLLTKSGLLVVRNGKLVTVEPGGAAECVCCGLPPDIDVCADFNSWKLTKFPGTTWDLSRGGGIVAPCDAWPATVDNIPLFNLTNGHWTKTVSHPGFNPYGGVVFITCQTSPVPRIVINAAWSVDIGGSGGGSYYEGFKYLNLPVHSSAIWTTHTFSAAKGGPLCVGSPASVDLTITPSP